MNYSTEMLRIEIEKYLGTAIPDDGKSFFEMGILDSFEAINLVMHLREAFSVPLGPEDFAEGSHFSFNHIASAIQAKL